MNMILKIVQILVTVFIQRLTSTQVKEVTTLWTYKEENSTAMPDFIQIDFQIENGKFLMNLVKQPLATIEPPSALSQSEGQKSLWKYPEFLGIYEDHSFNASATVAVKIYDGVQEVNYMMTFIHGNKSYYLEPVGISSDQTASRNEEAVVDKSEFILIDGRLHKLIETQITKSSHNMDGDNADLLIGNRVNKRSVQGSGNKRLLTFKIYTIIDYAIFKKFFEASKASNEQEKKEYARKSILYIFTHIMENVKQLYENIDIEGSMLTIKWIGAFIAENAEDVPFFESTDAKIDQSTIDADFAMKDLNRWTSTRNENEDDKPKLPAYDFLVAFSSHSFRLKGANEVSQGRAYSNSACDTENVGIIHYTDFFNTVKTLAHEMGHALGIAHDGGTCSGEDYFLMSPRTMHITQDNLSNFFRFSECSVRDLKKYIDLLDRDKRNCLLQGGTRFDIGHNADQFLNIYPGQLFDLHAQCKMMYGPESHYCEAHTTVDQMCINIICVTNNACVVKGIALDGTPCSDGSWCIRGNCTPDSRSRGSPITKSLPNSTTPKTITTTFPKTTTTIISTTSTKRSPQTRPRNYPPKRNFRGVVEYIDVMGEVKSMICEELVTYDPSVCHYVDAIKAACSASCTSFKNECSSDDSNVVVQLHSRELSCQQILENDVHWCKEEKEVRIKCCKSCKDFLRKSVKVQAMML